MPFDPTDDPIGDNQQIDLAALINQLMTDLRTHLESIPATELPAPLVLDRSRQDVDGGYNTIHDFAQWLGTGANNVHIRDVGAYSGAVAQDAAFQAAIDIGPGVVIFPPGSYRIADTLDMTGKTNVLLLGFGPASVLTLGNAGDAAMIDFEGSTGCGIIGMRLDGRSAVQTTGVYSGIDARNCSGFTVANCIVEDIMGYGIRVGQNASVAEDFSSRIQVIGNRVWDCTDTGIFCEIQDSTPHSSFSPMEVSYNEVYSNGGDGIQAVPNETGMQVAFNNVHDNAGSGIVVYDIPEALTECNTSIHGNVCKSNDLHGIRIGSNLINTVKATIYSNICESNGGDGVRLTGSADVVGLTVNSNLLHDNLGHGINFEGGLDGEGLVGIYAFTGFEEGGTEEFLTNQPGGTGTVAHVITPVKNGAYAIRLIGSVADTARVALVLSNSDGEQGGQIPGGIGRMTFYFRIAVAPAASSEEFAELAFAIGSQPAAFLRLNSARQIELWRQGAVNPALVATGTTVLALDTWYRIDFGLTGTDTGTATCNVLIDNVPEHTNVSVTMTGSFNIGAAIVGKRTNRNSQSVEYFFDDVTFGDVFAGSNHRVFVAVPVDTAFDPDGTPYTGTHADIDEVPISDADFMTLNDTGTDESREVRFNIQDTADIGEVGVKIDGVKMTQRWWRTGGTQSVVTTAVLGEELSGDMGPWTTTPATRILFYRNYLGAAWTNDIFDALLVGWNNGNLTPTFSEHRISSLKVHVLYGEAFPSGDGLAMAFYGNVIYNNTGAGINFESLGDIKTSSVLAANVVYNNAVAAPTQLTGIELSAMTEKFALIGNIIAGHPTANISNSGSAHDISHNVEAEDANS